jgi:TolB protein
MMRRFASLSCLVFAACSEQPTAPVITVPAADLVLDAPSAHTVAYGGGPPGSVVFHSARGGTPQLFVMNPDGSDQRLVPTGAGNVQWPDISTNGRFAVLTSNRSGNNEIYVADLKDCVADPEGCTLVNVSNHPGDDNWARVSPNGHRIVFHSNRDGNYNIYTVNPDGTDLQRVTSDPALDQWPDWSPDGKRIAFRRGTNIYVADAEGEEQNVQPLTFLPTINQMPAWSPDGHQIAFMSLREGYPSVFLMSAEGDTPDHPAVNLTPKDAADPATAWLSRAPAWSRNGKQIYFMSFRPSTGGNVELFVMNADGTDVTRLTTAPGEDGGPRTR